MIYPVDSAIHALNNPVVCEWFILAVHVLQGTNQNAPAPFIVDTSAYLLHWQGVHVQYMYHAVARHYLSIMYIFNTHLSHSQLSLLFSAHILFLIATHGLTSALRTDGSFSDTLVSPNCLAVIHM